MLQQSFRTKDFSIQTLEKVIHPELLELANQPHSNVEMVSLQISDDGVATVAALFVDDTQQSHILPEEDVEHFKHVFNFFSKAMNRFHKPDGTYMVPIEAIETAGDIFIPLLKCSHVLVNRISDEAKFADDADIVGYRVMNHVVNHTGPNRELIQMREVLVPTSLGFGTTGRDEYDYWFPFLVVANEICFCGTIGSPVLIKSLPEDNPTYKNMWTGRTYWLPTGDAQIVYENDRAIGTFEYEGVVNRFALTDIGAIPQHAPYLGISSDPKVETPDPQLLRI